MTVATLVMLLGTLVMFRHIQVMMLAGNLCKFMRNVVIIDYQVKKKLLGKLLG